VPDTGLVISGNASKIALYSAADGGAVLDTMPLAAAAATAEGGGAGSNAERCTSGSAAMSTRSSKCHMKLTPSIGKLTSALMKGQRWQWSPMFTVVWWMPQHLMSCPLADFKTGPNGGEVER
jgi:hypothetical protein